MCRHLATALLAVLFGCGGDGETDAPPPAESTCAAPELSLPDGSCIRPGVPPDGCAAGFAHDGEYGCEPVLPAAPCAEGLMAVPGESDCRAVMPCGAGKWGDIPIDANTVYVDRAYTGLDADGSADKPFGTVSAGVAAAPAGALVAIAQGSYPENVVVQGKALRLWGVCPQQVEIVGSFQSANCPPAALCVASFANGTEVHGIALRGAGVGFALSGSTGVVLDRVWVHHNDNFGIDAESNFGATAITVWGSLLEDNHEVGILAIGVDLTVEASVVRETWPALATQIGGYGIGLQKDCIPSATGLSCDPTSVARGVVRGSVIEQNHGGMVASGAEATVEATVVRGNFPGPTDEFGGVGIAIQVPCGQLGGEPFCDPTFASHAVVRTSYLAQNHHVGVRVSGSEAAIETSVIREQLSYGMGVLIRGVCRTLLDGTHSCDPDTSSRVTLRASLLEQNRYITVLISGSEATVEDTVIRGTQPRDADSAFGRGIGTQWTCSKTSRGTVFCAPDAPGNVTVRGSLIADNHGEGLHVVGSKATVERSLVSQTNERADGNFGDGVAVFSDLAPASISVENTRILDSGRAGLASFGAAVALQGTHIQCAAFELDGEEYLEFQYSFENAGDVLCGCPRADQPCKVVSAGLSAPEPVHQQ